MRAKSEVDHEQEAAHSRRRHVPPRRADRTRSRTPGWNQVPVLGALLVPTTRRFTLSLGRTVRPSRVAPAAPTTRRWRLSACGGGHEHESRVAVEGEVGLVVGDRGVGSGVTRRSLHLAHHWAMATRLEQVRLGTHQLLVRLESLLLMWAGRCRQPGSCHLASDRFDRPPRPSDAVDRCGGSPTVGRCPRSRRPTNLARRPMKPNPGLRVQACGGSVATNVQAWRGSTGGRHALDRSDRTPSLMARTCGSLAQVNRTGLGGDSDGAERAPCFRLRYHAR